MSLRKHPGSLALLAAASALAVWGASARASITNGLNSPGSWALNGTSTYTPFITSGDLTLTTAGGGEQTSAWYTTAQDVSDSWTASFTYQLSGTPSGSSPADGFMFVVQNGATTALGSGGGSKGYENPASTGFTAVSPSVGLGIELYYNAASYGQMGVNGIFVNGGNIPGSTLNLSTDINPINYTISYYAPTSSYSVSAVDSTNSADAYNYIVYGMPNLDSTPINVNSTLGSTTGYVGFTGATGGAYSEQDITNFNFTTNTGATQPAGYTPPVTPAYILQTRAPVALTAGSFNVDNVVENTATVTTNTAIASSVATPFGNVNAFYEAGTAVSGTVLPGGLPTSHQFVSQADGTTTFQFQHYTNTNNALRLTSATGGTSSGTMTLATPSGFSTLAILATSGNAGNNTGGTVTLNFADGSTVTTDFGAPDWFAGTTAGTTPDGNMFGVAIYGGVGRIDVQNADTSGYPGNPNLYETVLNLSSLGTGTGTVDVAGKVIDSLTFTVNPTIGQTDIFAVSGATATTPEPSPLILIAAGCAGLLLTRRRLARVGRS